MAIDFDKIDKSVDLEGLRKDVEEASANGTGDFPTIPAGKYEVALVSLEIKGTKKDNRPMLAASFKILSGEYKNQRLFMNRVLYGTKNDGNMIKSAVGWLDTLESGVAVSFEGYKQFKIIKGREKNPEQFANTPEHCFIINDDVTDRPIPDELDKGYYIQWIYDRLKDFGVEF